MTPLESKQAEFEFLVDLDIIRTNVQARKWWHHGIIPPPRKRRKRKYN